VAPRGHCKGADAFTQCLRYESPVRRVVPNAALQHENRLLPSVQFMTPSRTKIHRLALLATLVLAGCATTPPPLTGLDDASATIARARAADAQLYAPVELRFAETKVTRARAAIEGKRHDEAARLLAQAEIDAEFALAKSRTAKARAAAEQKARDNAALERELLGEHP